MARARAARAPAAPADRGPGGADQDPGDGRLSRRRALRLGAAALAAPLLAACAARNAERGEDADAGSTVIRGGGEGRLRARPGAESAADAPPASGLAPLGLGGERDGLVLVPSGGNARGPRALVVLLHGAGGNARHGIAPLQELADEHDLILVAPESRGPTWDVLLGGYGRDVRFIDRVLEATFARHAVDPARVAVGGFSDGASYALSLGLTNGDLFRSILAFSPGFSAPAAQEGEPRIFVSHGTDDRVLPIERCSRRLVPALQRAGYAVHYREFDGPHTVPPAIAREAVAWFEEPG